MQLHARIIVVTHVIVIKLMAVEIIVERGDVNVRYLMTVHVRTHIVLRFPVPVVELEVIVFHGVLLEDIKPVVEMVAN